MTENKRFIRIVDHPEKEVRIYDTINEKKIFNIFFNELDSAICLNGALTDTVDLLNDYAYENEQLKQYIYDNLDEDICDVCSYQYLEKSQMDKYYVAKCKKGYDNCSKGTVIHCKDFKFKELQE